MQDKPTEPVIEVAPGEPHEHCDYCFTVKPCVLEDSSGRMMCQDCLDKAAASTGAPAVPAQPETWDALSRQCTLAAKNGQIPDELYDRALAARERENRPAVPAQEAPRAAGICGKSGTVGYQQVRCTRLRGHDHLCAQLTPDGLYALDFVPAEPQAGAQAHKLEVRSVTEVNGAGVQRETWQECSVCRETFGEYDYIGPCKGQFNERQPKRCEHKEVSQGALVGEGYMVVCDECGEDLTTPAQAEQAGAPVPSRDYKEMWLKAVDHGLAQHIIKVRENTKLREELGRVNTHLNSIRNYATEAAKTPITRESILAAPQVDEAPIPENLKMAYGMYKKSGLGGPAELIERIAQLEAENRARKLTQLTQSDEMQGFCRLVLSEIGGGL